MNKTAPRVLVVDDVPGFRAILRDMLEEMGITQIEEASDGGEALLKAQGGNFSLVISDYMMEPQNGLQLLEGIRCDPRLAEKPFIMISAASEMDFIEKAMELGAQSYITRPISFPILRRQVLDALELE